MRRNVNQGMNTTRNGNAKLAERHAFAHQDYSGFSGGNSVGVYPGRIEIGNALHRTRHQVCSSRLFTTPVIYLAFDHLAGRFKAYRSMASSRAQ
jgi:hypothetical protein